MYRNLSSVMFANIFDVSQYVYLWYTCSLPLTLTILNIHNTCDFEVTWMFFFWFTLYETTLFNRYTNNTIPSHKIFFHQCMIFLDILQLYFIYQNSIFEYFD